VVVHMHDSETQTCHSAPGSSDDDTSAFHSDCVRYVVHDRTSEEYEVAMSPLMRTLAAIRVAAFDPAVVAGGQGETGLKHPLTMASVPITREAKATLGEIR